MPLNRSASQSSAAAQRGLSLVEMMVGVAIGLFIVAGATVLVSSQLHENRRLLLDTQIQQDLRATADIITREFRRAGYSWISEGSMWRSDLPAQPPLPNIRSGFTINAANDDSSYHYDREPPFLHDFRFAQAGFVIRSYTDTNPQDLTDGNTLIVTKLDIRWNDAGTGTAIQVACPKLCADLTQSCWPTVKVRELVVTIQGKSASDDTIKRSITTRVRLRNDLVNFNAPATQVCP